MTATTFDPSTVKVVSGRQPRLLGLGNLVRKDLADWLYSKRPWVVVLVTTAVFALAAANSRIRDRNRVHGPRDDLRHHEHLPGRAR